MLRSDGAFPIQIGDGAGYFEHAVIGARRDDRVCQRIQEPVAAIGTLDAWFVTDSGTPVLRPEGSVSRAGV